MSLRLEMLQVARLAPKILGDASDLVRSFLLGQCNDDGGFRDRIGRSDLYYTVFGLEALLALDQGRESLWPDRLPAVKTYLASHGSGEGLDFVHLCCLARCWASAALLAKDAPPNGVAAQLAERLEAYRTPDGGFNAVGGAERGTAYGAFLGLGAYQDLGHELPDADRVADSLHGLRASDGVWANEANTAMGSTNATAAALSVLNNRQCCLPEEAGRWLARQAHEQGGFKAMPRAPIPDLLSTATALHALSAFDWDLAGQREKHLDFIDTLWTNEGSFHGNWTDEDLDAEYTYYGLLALGHLSV